MSGDWVVGNGLAQGEAPRRYITYAYQLSTGRLIDLGEKLGDADASVRDIVGDEVLVWFGDLTSAGTYNLATGETTRFEGTGSTVIAEGLDGDLAVGWTSVAAGGHAAMWTRPQSVTAAVVTFADRCGVSADTFTIPSANHVDYLVGGTVKPAGTYPATGTVAVSAKAHTGYTLRGDSSWSWTFTNVSAFTDVPPGTQFFDEMCWMADQSISTGWPVTGGKEYRPLRPVNRDAMAAFMYRLAGSPAFTAPATSPFVDIAPSSQFYKEMAWLASEGISTGWPVTGGKEYRPLQPVNRDAMAAFMYRLKVVNHLV